MTSIKSANTTLHSLDDIRRMTSQEVAALPATTLLVLQDDARRLTGDIKKLSARLDEALYRKYGKITDHCHTEEFGPAAGQVKIIDGMIQVTAEYPYLIDWNQQQLARIAKAYYLRGDDPANYMTITYAIDEEIYRSWSDPLKMDFFPARHASVGTPSFSLNWRGDHEFS